MFELLASFTVTLLYFLYNFLKRLFLLELIFTERRRHRGKILYILVHSQMATKFGAEPT